MSYRFGDQLPSDAGCAVRLRPAVEEQPVAERYIVDVDATTGGTRPLRAPQRRAQRGRFPVQRLRCGGPIRQSDPLPIPHRIARRRHQGATQPGLAHGQRSVDDHLGVAAALHHRSLRHVRPAADVHDDPAAAVRPGADAILQRGGGARVQMDRPGSRLPVYAGCGRL